MQSVRDSRVIDKYNDLVRKFLTKNENFDAKKFVGGMPVTLERKDILDLTLKGPNGNFVYTATQKVDGERMLMYIGFDNGDKNREVCFINRKNEIKSLFIEQPLPNVRTPEMLLDGELVYFDKEGKSYKEYKQGVTRHASFMAFDILYGPEKIEVENDVKVIGQSFSMTVPEDGVLRSLQWIYINRYDMLHKMIVPSGFNKNLPILTEAFKNVPWFNVELKPIYFLGQIKDRVEVYSYLSEKLSENRRNFYDFLSAEFKKPKSPFVNRKLNLDGLIFTSAETLYTLGNWDIPGKKQFKWKPSEQQTVDLMVRKIDNNSANLLVLKGDRHEVLNFNRKIAVSTVPADSKNGDILEFKISGTKQDLNFVFDTRRLDKKKANAIRTVLGVINSYLNPVDIRKLHLFLNLETLKTNDIKDVLKIVPINKLTGCAVKNVSGLLLDENLYNTIKRLIRDSVNKEIELEIRLGEIKGRFDPDINQDKFTLLQNKVERLGFKKEITDFVDIYSSERLRTRYIYSSDFQKYILFESIIKNRITNVDLNSNKTLDFDIRFSLSQEKKVSKYNTEGESTSKSRISYVDPNGLLRFDLTTIKEGTFVDREFTEKQGSKIKRQFELEILSNKVDPRKLFSFLASVIN